MKFRYEISCSLSFHSRKNEWRHHKSSVWCPSGNPAETAHCRTINAGPFDLVIIIYKIDKQAEENWIDAEKQYRNAGP